MALPTRRIGKGLTSVVITPATVDTAGAVTDVTASAFTCTTLMEGLAQSLRSTNEEMSAVNADREHYVHIIDGHYLTFNVIEGLSSGDYDTLQTLVQTYDHFKFAYTQGGKTHTGYGVRNEHASGTQGKGKQVVTLTLDPVDNGTASFVRS